MDDEFSPRLPTYEKRPVFILREPLPHIVEAPTLAPVKIKRRIGMWLLIVAGIAAAAGALAGVFFT